MATVVNQHRGRNRPEQVRTGPQRVCISGGYGFIVVGFLGVVMPGVLGLHLSVLHNLIHIFSGAIALWCGYSSAARAFNFNLFFGALYALSGIVGFILGEPGYPSVGHLEADQNLLRVIPNFLEFGTMDHTFHSLVGIFLLFTAYTFRKEKRYKSGRLGH